jgi:hypothetical protein
MEGRNITEIPALKGLNSGGYGGYYINMGALVCAIAVFVTACLAVGGKLPASTVGTNIMGFGAGTIASTLLLYRQKDGSFSETFKNRKGTLLNIAILFSIYMTLGALSYRGVLSAHKVGVGLLVTTFGSGVVERYYFARLNTKQEESALDKMRTAFRQGIGLWANAARQEEPPYVHAESNAAEKGDEP